MSESGALIKEIEDDSVWLQYLTFHLDSDILGVELKEIKEVLEVKELTILPRTPDYMRGVTNLRGQLIPVIDLKSKFGMGLTEFTIDTCVIIVEITVNDEIMSVGALVDSVRGVVEFTQSAIDPAPKMGSSIDVRFILGMGKHDNEFFSILDIPALFTIEELSAGEAMGPVSSQIN
ncbi:MAG: chemotaxis protein CheW [Alteromonadaceae bacterium]|nr:MAG: chemotaxis protein CheW [Alteromonadaceae bacterium]